MAFRKAWLIVILIYGLLPPLISTAPCFITNCPPGGKRSPLGDVLSPTPVMLQLKRPQCLACGPGGAGRCVGSKMCCGPTVGCYLNTRETKICMWSPFIAADCDQHFTPDLPDCSSGANELTKSYCVADGLCCSAVNQGQCKMDSACSTN